MNTNRPTAGTPTSHKPSSPKPSLVRRLMRPLNHMVENYLPSAMTFAIILTLLVAAMALALTDSSPKDVLISWGDGLTGLLSFMTQMALVLLLGTTLASTRPVNALLTRLSALPRRPLTAYVFVFVIGAIGCLITWGLGIIVGGLLARLVAVQFSNRGEPISFPMLIASAYSGFIVWHMGYSGSAPLIAATPDSFVSESLGETIPLTSTIFSWWNLLAIGLTIVVVSITLYVIAPRSVPDKHIVDETVIEETLDKPEEFPSRTAADKIDNSRWLTSGFSLIVVAYLVAHFAGGGSTTLDIVNWIFLALILLMVSNVNELLSLVHKAASNVGDILLQFPLYAGIMGIMTASGLVTVISNWMLSVSTPETLGLWSFFSAGLVNFFVPSGGGQIAVQGPILLEAGAQLGVDPSILIMALAYGDQWTNMIQPFWALPLLALAGLRVRDILGYTTAVFITSGITLGGAILTIGFLFAS